MTNFWQDFGRDWRAGRLYAPRAEQIACNAHEADLEAGRMGPAWDRVRITPWHSPASGSRTVARCATESPAACAELRMTWLGGARILEQVDRMRDQLLTRRPAIGRRDIPLLLWRAARWT